MNTHILPDVEMICDRVAIIVKGQIRHQGRIEDFLPEAGRQTDVVLGGLPPETADSLGERFDLKMRGLGDRVELQVAEKDVHRSARFGNLCGGGSRVRYAAAKFARGCVP